MLEGVENKIMGAKTRIYAYYCVPLAPPVSNRIVRMMASHWHSQWHTGKALNSATLQKSCRKGNTSNQT
jgi:hypothetical protein